MKRSLMNRIWNLHSFPELLTRTLDLCKAISWRCQNSLRISVKVSHGALSHLNDNKNESVHNWVCLRIKPRCLNLKRGFSSFSLFCSKSFRTLEYLTNEFNSRGCCPSSRVAALPDRKRSRDGGEKWKDWVMAPCSLSDSDIFFVLCNTPKQFKKWFPTSPRLWKASGFDSALLLKTVFKTTLCTHTYSQTLPHS